MTNNKKKNESKNSTSQKKFRRKLLSIYRVIRYGTDSFIRNSWLSIAATAVMTITLLIIFTSFVAQNVLTDTVTALRNKVDMSIYLKTDTSDKVGANLVSEVLKLSSVKTARFISSDEAQRQIVDTNKGNDKVLEAIKEATNKTPATLRVNIKDINNTKELEEFVANNELIKKNINPDFKPSFAGDRLNTIKSIGRAVNFAQKIGIVAGSLFVFISSLIIFNTIRMAIFNRKEEIQMMKLIGADKSFIRGPFLIEAVIYGFIAAIITTALGMWILYSTSKTLVSYQIAVQPTIDFVTMYAWSVLLAMIGIGSVIGVISSLLATYRYLKI